MNYTDTEIWMDIKGFEGYYQVSSHGRVKSFDRVVRRKHTTSLVRGVILKTPKNNGGYCNVKLYRSGDKTFVSKKVHRLVADAFVENPNGKNVVNHIDGQKDNNHYSNLEWCTQKENMHHAFNNGLIVHKKAGQHMLAKTIYQFDKNGLLLTNIFPSCIDAAISVGGEAKYISSCARGERASAYGSVWKYAAS